MKNINRVSARLSVLALTLLLCVGALSSTNAAQQEAVEYPMLAPFAPALQEDGSARYITAQEIEKNIRQHSKEFQKLYWNKEIKHFIVPKHGWLDDLLDFYADFLKRTGIQGKADTWDCENFSSMLNALTTIRIWKAGYYDTRGAIGWMRVDAKEEWAGLPGVMHALMFAVTDEGVFVIEPQNGETIELASYPNRFYIQEVFLF